MRYLQAGLLIVLVVALVATPYTRRHMFAADALGAFAAFSCGGAVLRQGHDPYRTEPLRTCERALPSYRYGAAGVVEPAPFPPVVLAAFAPLSALPFAWAFGAYAALALAACVCAAWALQRMTGFSPAFVGASLAIGVLYQDVRFGQLPPLVIGIACAAALLLERGRPRAAAVVAALAAIEPHVAGPVLLALFIGVKASRAMLAVVGVALAAVCAVALDPALTVEYVTRALPAHALAEVSANDQFSVTWIAHALGAGDAAALRAGAASYALTTVLGIVAGLRLARRFARPAFVVLVPAAFAVIGGTFIHDIQLPVAIPAALLLASVTTGRVRALALVAVAGLALTWFDDLGAVLALGALAVLAWTAPLPWTSTPRRAAFAVLACVGYACIILVFHKLSPGVHAALPPHPDVGGPPDELASDVWGRFVRATAYGRTSVRTFAEKLPLWFALAALACAVLRAAASPGALRRAPTSTPSR